MQLKYVDTKEEIIAVNKKSKHIEPHLHNALEIVCITSGTLELGVGQELYHMKKGDIGFVFPLIYEIMSYIVISSADLLRSDKFCNVFFIINTSFVRKTAIVLFVFPLPYTNSIA